MSTILLGLFKDSKQAGEAASELKAKGFTKEISILAYDKKYAKPTLHEVKRDASGGTKTGATLGAITGVLAGIFSGISSVVVPGIGLLVGGPLIALLGVTGGVIGSLAGGVVGALIDLGINEPTAKLYDKAIKRGEILVGASIADDATSAVRSMMARHGATDISTIYPS